MAGSKGEEKKHSSMKPAHFSFPNTPHKEDKFVIMVRFTRKISVVAHGTLLVVLPLDNITFRRWKQTHFYIHLGLLLPLGGLETVEKEHQKLYLPFAFYNAKFRSTFETGITRVHTMSRFLTTQQSKWLSQVNVVSGTHYHIRSTITMATEARIDAW